MYTFIREVTFKSMADSVRGMPVAAALCKYYKDAHMVDMVMLHAVSGSPNRIRFVAQFASLDAWMVASEQAMKDESFQQLLAEIAPTVDASKTYDEFWK